MFIIKGVEMTHEYEMPNKIDYVVSYDSHDYQACHGNRYWHDTIH